MIIACIIESSREFLILDLLANEEKNFDVVLQVVQVVCCLDCLALLSLSKFGKSVKSWKTMGHANC